MIIVCIVVALCLVYAVRRVYIVMRKPDKGCDCCNGCHGACQGCP